MLSECEASPFSSASDNSDPSHSPDACPESAKGTTAEKKGLKTQASSLPRVVADVPIGDSVLPILRATPDRHHRATSARAAAISARIVSVFRRRIFPAGVSCTRRFPR